MSPSAAATSFIIVGAGVFGASTAYHLAKAIPAAAITLIDRSPFPCPLAASYDYNKIVRADYGDKFYMSLALKSQHQWRTDPLYKQFFHESGMVNIEGTGLGRQMVQNFKDLGVDSKAEVVGPEELRKRYPLFWDADYEEAKDCYVNPEAGWAEATSALRAVIAEAVSYGVEFVQGSISRLLFDEERDCIGVELKDGRKLEAGKVVLATGANTARILADSAPERQELQADERIMGAAVVCGMVRLTDEQVELYKEIPLFLHRVNGVNGETYPPTPEKVIKFTRDISFSNFQAHKASGQSISSPPIDRPNEGQTDVPESLKREIQTVMNGIWGRQFSDNEMKISSYRIC
ncbi:MAG: hypothetical protein Q9207_007377, partial [Kuettlingeria erythrocarpa]